jgi:hypothetical protein
MEHQIAGDTDRGNRLFSTTPDPVEIGEEIFTRCLGIDPVVRSCMCAFRKG